MIDENSKRTLQLIRAKAFSTCTSLERMTESERFEQPTPGFIAQYDAVLELLMQTETLRPHLPPASKAIMAYARFFEYWMFYAQIQGLIDHYLESERRA